MTDKVFEVEYHPGDETVVLRFKVPPRLPFVPEPAREHFKAARKEMLLAFRSFLDKAIEHAEKAEKRGKSRTKIEVQ